ncbi:hypothetical protein [Fodinibius saliphilus]|uniref:hypothetical protein n=1 Tax=Fodinibius saliphilus TaxID=1920650 RepID=UPI0011081F9B|nr:hypothetical protein [Fodinibius saliphilus]
MFEKTIYCKKCREKIGRDILKIASDDNSEESQSKQNNNPSFDQEFIDQIDAEKTEKLGFIVRIPCPHCSEYNFLSMY